MEHRQEVEEQKYAQEELTINRGIKQELEPEVIDISDDDSEKYQPTPPPPPKRPRMIRDFPVSITEGCQREDREYPRVITIRPKKAVVPKKRLFTLLLKLCKII